MLEIGSLVDGKYRILSKIGQGGMSVVYMAINEKANKTWAVKEVRKDGVLDFEAVKQGLVAETDILKKLSHPNLPSIIDVIDTDDSFIIIMDYIEGNALSKSLKEFGAQPQEYVIEWAKQMCDVLGYLHSRQPAIIYRDIKPANIMLKPDGNIALIDFGTAREFKEKNLADTTCLGTVGYAAPEQYGGMGQTDARTDIYGLGATLYHLVTGCNPSEPPYEIKPIREINPSLSSGLERIIQKCVQRNPDERYQSAAELMYALDHYEEIDDIYRKKQIRRLSVFIGSAAMSVILACVGLSLHFFAGKQATATYEAKLSDASYTYDYSEKLRLYEEAIAVPDKAGVKDAYLGLIKAYKENDAVFDGEEAKQLERLIRANRAELMKDPEGYTEICFETGKLFWYYYEENSGSALSRTNHSIDWFQTVVSNATESYENYRMAKVYLNVGKFYRDIQANIAEANDKGTYRELFDNLKGLMDEVAFDENEGEIVRLELVELVRSAAQQYATKFKLDGVSVDELMGLYGNASEALSKIEVPKDDKTDVRTVKKTKIEQHMQDTKVAIETAYGTGKGE